MFLDEKEVVAKIRENLQNSDRARLAVAFWGNGAIDQLGLADLKMDLEIICNLESGACNPSEIRKLQGIAGVDKILTDPRLHAKVYWTPKAAIVGSSNASINGLVTEGTLLAGWAEANILIEDPEILRNIDAWFDLRRASSTVVQEQALVVAEEIWKKRKKLSAPGIKFTGNLLEAYKLSPDHTDWGRVQICLWTRDIDERGKREKDAAEKARLILPDMYAYQDLNDQITAGDWLIEFKVSTAAASKFFGIYEVPMDRCQSETLTYAWRRKDVELPAFGKLRLSHEDTAALEKIAQNLFETKAGTDDTVAFVSLSEIVAELAKREQRAFPDPSAFEQILRNNYESARNIGYVASDFLRMLNSSGGVGTAKILLNQPKISDGFVTLWQKGRQDLTVEYVVLQEPWCRLFTDKELRTARLRLQPSAKT